MIWQIMDIETFKSEYFKELSDLIRKYGFVNSTIRNKWAKEKAVNPNELEIFILVEKYKITRVKIN